MDLDEYQDRARLTAGAYEDGCVDEARLDPPDRELGARLSYVALGLASEAGEFASLIKKRIRDGRFDHEKATKELGDVLWYVAMAAKELGVSLQFVAIENLAKLASRAERGEIHGSGDDR